MSIRSKRHICGHCNKTRVLNKLDFKTVRMEINYNNTWAVIKAADQIEIKQTNGWVLRYGLWTPSSDAIVKWVDNP